MREDRVPEMSLVHEKKIWDVFHQEHLWLQCCDDARVLQIAFASQEIIETAWQGIQGTLEGRHFLFAIAVKTSARSDRLYQALFEATGYDAIALLKEQQSLGLASDRVFPVNGRSLGTAFRRACRDLKIEDLHFHDLRHEATSRLFEAGFDIPEVSLVTGHKDWKMLRRYLNLRPHQLVGRAPRARY